MAQASDEVTRQYSVYPAIEQTKLMIISKINLMFDIVNRIVQDQILGRKDEEVIALLKSTVISIYILLKPKIVEYQTQMSKYNSSNNIMSKEMFSQILSLDEKLRNPSNFSIMDAIAYADILNLFCHEYGVTKITYFAGTIKPDNINYIGGSGAGWTS